ncbi:hypothetical protein [Telluribacter sp.]|jgi:hypothetical protein|uniref:hypothetical protein n=1 Tax=Telluribacter sp. TaxID=1978767 RepID=UPI002E156202|nr:hypothetical protein [Telluribacter sp.]
MLYVVKYSGHFGFIKPWTAVRDSETFSQQFLTPSMVEGIEKKLFPELLSEKGIHKIVRHKLTYAGISRQQEKTQTLGWEYKKQQKMLQRPQSILVRGVLLYPDLYLAFHSLVDAEQAATQHICLCRNEDILWPLDVIQEYSPEGFDALEGFELQFGNGDGAFLVGYNRFDGETMYGSIKVSPNPLKSHGL